MSRATIADVARLAGVSIKTVSRVANREPNVREVTRSKVQAAIDALDYRANEHARQMAARRHASAGRVGMQNALVSARATRQAQPSAVFAASKDSLQVDWD